jgi:adenine-specific DNA-methyltransferase
MALIENLIEEIQDPELRHKLLSEIKNLKDDKKFGLVFEEHLPEIVFLYNAPIKRGASVIRKTGPSNQIYRVLSVKNDLVNCISEIDKTEETIEKDNLVVIKRFGEPIFPTLVPIERVECTDKPFNVLIEADNYHALQLLEYLYPGQVDCIYIDPPYNTGARDWKYNNHYVDINDSYRHSKWLSFMKKRLVLAKRLLSPYGTLIIAIDDNELAHLVCLLEDLFPHHDLTIVTVVHNPRGNITKNFAQVHEYAVYLTPKGVSTISRMAINNTAPRKLRRWGHNSTREARPTMFYPIYVKDGKITRIGEVPPKDYHPPGRNVPVGSGEIEVWPIDQHGIERRWNYGLDTIGQHLDRIIVQERDGEIDLFLSAELSPPKTIMIQPEFDAGGVYGSTLVETITGTKFPYPKSLYTVLKCIEPVVKDKPNALILDFFAGSGTTFNAVALLNAIYGGNRQCILVTNNEVHPEELANDLISKGFQRGTPEFERHGICQSVTFPRCKNVITGRKFDGSPLPGEYLTGRTIQKEIRRTIRALGFTTPEQLQKIKERKQLAAVIGLTQSKVEENVDWYLQEDEPLSVLFNPDKLDEYCQLLAEQGEHLTTIYLVMPEGAVFRKAKDRILNVLPPLYKDEVETRPLSLGFEENLQYFRLEFLDPTSIELGRNFSELLPTLWMMSGAKGSLPFATGKEPYIFPEGCSFAVLLQETYFKEFREELKNHQEITHVFLVTDSDDAFFAMKQEINAYKVIQLYRNYVDNFRINVGVNTK